MTQVASLLPLFSEPLLDTCCWIIVHWSFIKIRRYFGGERRKSTGFFLILTKSIFFSFNSEALFPSTCFSLFAKLKTTKDMKCMLQFVTRLHHLKCWINFLGSYGSPLMCHYSTPSDVYQRLNSRGSNLCDGTMWMISSQSLQMSSINALSISPGHSVLIRL